RTLQGKTKRRPRRPELRVRENCNTLRSGFKGAHARRVTVAQDLDGAPVLEGNRPGEPATPRNENTTSGSDVQYAVSGDRPATHKPKPTRAAVEAHCSRPNRA